MRNEAIFRRRTAIALLSISGTALAVTLFFLVFSDVPAEIDSAGSDSFSVSALGYHALVELLKHDVPVLVSRQDSARKAAPGKPLLVLEPSGRGDRIERLRELLETARRRRVPTLVVLPKWRGTPKLDRRDWVERVALVPVAEPARVLAEVLGTDDGVDAVQPRDAAGETVVRLRDAGSAWRGELAGAAVPDLVLAPQLMRLDDPEIDVVLGSRRGALVARSRDGLVWVVSDPDLLNTAGLARGDNALIAHGLVIGALEPRALVVDEVLHGFARNRNLWNELIRFPLICFSLHLLALLALAAWGTTSRFGRPLPAPSRLPPGKLTLVDNMARLLLLGGDVKRSLRGYLELTVRQVTRRWGARPEGGLRRQVEHLAALGRGRKVSEDLESLATRVARWPSGDADPRRALELARGLHRWRKEMLDGLATRP